MAKSSDNLNKAYELLLKRRQENVDKSLARASTPVTRTALPGSEAQAADTLSNVNSNIAEQGGLMKNLENTVKTTPDDLLGIDPKLAYKSRFPSTSKTLDAARTISEESAPIREDVGSILKSTKGASSGVLPMIGLGAAALGGMGVAKKLGEGDYGNAALDAADIGTDFIPGVGLAKMLLRPTEAGAADIPEDEMKERQAYNDARLSKAGKPVNYPATSQPLLAPEDRVKKEDLDALLKSIVLNRKQ
jgi:hypothetical protein